MELELYEVASGPCIVCGEDSQGSAYWLPMTAAQWDVLKPYVEAMTPVSPHSGVKLVFNTMFIPRLCKPFCGPECVRAYYRQVATDNLKMGA
ncbi:MAG: hypothetical protein V3R87_03625 [Dehalococcoidia bacterium]